MKSKKRLVIGVVVVVILVLLLTVAVVRPKNNPKDFGMATQTEEKAASDQEKKVQKSGDDEGNEQVKITPTEAVKTLSVTPAPELSAEPETKTNVDKAGTDTDEAGATEETPGTTENIRAVEGPDGDVIVGPETAVNQKGDSTSGAESKKESNVKKDESSKEQDTSDQGVELPIVPATE